MGCLFFCREVTKQSALQDKGRCQSLPSLNAPKNKPNFSCCNWSKSTQSRPPGRTSWRQTGGEGWRERDKSLHYCETVHERRANTHWQHSGLHLLSLDKPTRVTFIYITGCRGTCRRTWSSPFVWRGARSRMWEQRNAHVFREASVGRWEGRLGRRVVGHVTSVMWGSSSWGRSLRGLAVRREASRLVNGVSDVMLMYVLPHSVRWTRDIKCMCFCANASACCDFLI